MINFPFGTNGKLNILDAPILKHITVVFPTRCMGTVSGEASMPYSCLPSSQLGGQILKERIYSFRSKLFSFKADFSWKSILINESKQEDTTKPVCV